MITQEQLQQLAHEMYDYDDNISAADLLEAILQPVYHPPIIADREALRVAFGLECG